MRHQTEAGAQQVVGEEAGCQASFRLDRMFKEKPAVHHRTLGQRQAVVEVEQGGALAARVVRNPRDDRLPMPALRRNVGVRRRRPGPLWQQTRSKKTGVVSSCAASHCTQMLG